MTHDAVFVLIVTLGALALCGLVVYDLWADTRRDEEPEPYVPTVLPRRMDALPSPLLWANPTWPHWLPLEHDLVLAYAQDAYEWASEKLQVILSEVYGTPVVYGHAVRPMVYADEFASVT